MQDVRIYNDVLYKDNKYMNLGRELRFLYTRELKQKHFIAHTFMPYFFFQFYKL
jgi:hypothetical protein